MQSRGDVRETLIRRVRLDGTLAREIWATNLDTGAVSPVEPYWAAISRAEHHGRETFILYLCAANGRTIDVLQYDTLEIALDAAWDSTDVSPSQWEDCEIEVANDSDLRRAIMAAAETDEHRS